MHPVQLHWYLDAKLEARKGEDRKYAGMNEDEAAALFERQFGKAQ